MPGEGRVHDVAELWPGDHVCWQFGSDDEYAATLVSWVATGVERGERILALSGHVALDQQRAAVSDYGLRVDELVDSGQLVLQDARTALDAGSGFDSDSVLDGYRAAAHRAVADGYTALRVMADLGWVLDGMATPAGLVDYEIRAEQLLADVPMVALCGYDTRVTPRQAADQVCAVHPACAHEGSQPFSAVLEADGSFRLTGEVDLVCGQVWRGVLDALTIGPGEELVLDLSELRFIDATGLRALASAATVLAAHGCSLTLRSPRPVVRRCLEAMDPPDNLRWS